MEKRLIDSRVKDLQKIIPDVREKTAKEKKN